jgi:thiamine-phosphate pyrophosphorylase
LHPIETQILCYVTDRLSLEIPPGEDRERALLERIANAIAAGARWIQIREKDLETRALLRLTQGATAIFQAQERSSQVRIIVNDRADVAWAAGAAGVHLGENSIPVREFSGARAASGQRSFLLGASCHSLEAAIRAASDGADYLFFGPVFATPSKARFGPPHGVAKLREVCRAVNVPVLAIGGITAENATTCFEAGATGIAAIRLFQQARDLVALRNALGPLGR